MYISIDYLNRCEASHFLTPKEYVIKIVQRHKACDKSINMLSEIQETFKQLK